MTDTKDGVRQCITHHFACDCREADFKALKEENLRLLNILNTIKNIALKHPNESVWNEIKSQALGSKVEGD